ncbi:PREDICTED: BAG family molecular chaperone regulator 2-like [Nicotiana attenuata]|uniref:Bag family molecular chaperone regulator 1 n=1 Tax=Nicotiana attenuata TaxID=49451 RepID=A0A1J6L7Y6_NICAT|nr:PREDICTED: BAG family molecular chaperone regulator 2-like [Nicotiana attenuata]OIT27217.1 bag family molecular chaperone regulator 1 [Nicotiana attenuata]
MMRMKTKTTAVPPMMNGASAVGRDHAAENEWEVRPGGMLVQKRNPDSENRPPPSTIRVRVKYGSIYHEINISAQATFGELKKMLTGPTGLHHQDQKLLYKDKERDNNAFLDMAGIKDKSKIVLVEDPISQEKRYLEMRKNAKMEKAAKTISDISFEVDRLAGQVSAFETVISKGAKVAEKDLVNVIELLMNQLLKLDGITAEGDVKLQRKMQVKRVQKYVETLDFLKIKNSVPTSNGNHIPKQETSPSPQHHHHQRRYSNEQASSPVQNQNVRHSFAHSPAQTKQQQQPSRHSASGSVVITTQWETFDPAPASLLDHYSTTPTNNNHAASAQPRYNWDLL